MFHYYIFFIKSWEKPSLNRNLFTLLKFFKIYFSFHLNEEHLKISLSVFWLMICWEKVSTFSLCFSTLLYNLPMQLMRICCSWWCTDCFRAQECSCYLENKAGQKDTGMSPLFSPFKVSVQLAGKHGAESARVLADLRKDAAWTSITPRLLLLLTVTVYG